MAYRSNERALWRYLQRLLGRRWAATRHEDAIQAGVPDVSFGMDGVNGWLELKCAPDFPTRGKNKGLRRVKNLRRAQLNWMCARNQHAGHLFMLVRVGRDFYALYNAPNWEMAATHGIKQHGIVPGAIGVWRRGIDVDEFCQRLFWQTG